MTWAHENYLFAIAVVTIALFYSLKQNNSLLIVFYTIILLFLVYGKLNQIEKKYKPKIQVKRVGRWAYRE